MPPQKRGRNSDKSAPAHGSGDDAEMSEARGAAANGAGSPSDSDDDSDDSDDDDELTFNENMESDSDDDDDDDDDEDDEMDGGGKSDKDKTANDRNVNVEFVFSDPREEHFHSVSQFMLSYLPSSQPLNVSGLSNLIVNQVGSGTMICAEGETDVYGFITALSLSRYQDESALQQIVQYIVKKCPSTSEGARLKQILQTKSVGLVINERMVNLPYQLVPPLHSALHEDIEWAIENEGTPELRASFKMDYFLILSSCTMEKIGAVAAPGGNKKGKKAKTEYAQTAKFFANFEDEFLEPEAEMVFTFETPRGERERAEQTNKHSVVMLIERSRHKAALASIAAMINA